MKFTLVFEWSSFVGMMVRIGRFFSLSERHNGKGLNRRAREWITIVSSMMSFSLFSSRLGVTVERVLSNNLINWSECES